MREKKPSDLHIKNTTIEMPLASRNMEGAINKFASAMEKKS